MSDLEREKTEIPCPGGGSPIKTTYGDVAKKSSLKSSRGHEYKFKYSDQSKLKSAFKKLEKLQKDFEKDMEGAQEDFAEAYQNVIANADILLKR
jgi:glycyl-tRNA synthetase alpha subunit